MRKNFDMDAAIRRALRESIEAHAHEWEPKFNTGVGPVGDDAPFDKKVSCDVNEGKDCEDCCPKCGKCPCECDKVNEGTIPGDSHEWEPGFEAGVGEVGDDSPFTQAVNESLTDTNDWEDGSFGAGDHRKEGISFADGGDECQNGVVATGQKNSGEVISSDNLSEGEDEEEDESTLGQFIKNGWNGLKNRWNQAREQDMANKGWVRAGATGDGGDGGYTDNSGYQGNSGAGEQDVKTPTTDPSQKIIVGLLRAMAAAGQKDAAVNVLQKNKSLDAYWKYLNPKQPAKKQAAQTAQPEATTAQPAAPAQPAPAAAEQPAPAAAKQPAATTAQPASQAAPAAIAKASAPASTKKQRSVKNNSNIDPVTGKEAVYRESKEGEEDVIAEERDRFFNIMNRIEKLYD